MAQRYMFEPSTSEIMLTELLGRTLLQGYYRGFVRSLGLTGSERVLDYCAGSGIIADMIAAQLGAGQLVVADVSQAWLRRAGARLRRYAGARCAHLAELKGKVLGGGYDLIVVHFALHDFPQSLRHTVMQQLLENLRPGGTIYLREPLGDKHGFQLFELINLLEGTRQLDYVYDLLRTIAGKCVEIKCRWK